MTRTYSCNTVITLQATLLPALSAPTPRRGNLSISRPAEQLKGPTFPKTPPTLSSPIPRGCDPGRGYLNPTPEPPPGAPLTHRPGALQTPTPRSASSLLVAAAATASPAASPAAT